MSFPNRKIAITSLPSPIAAAAIAVLIGVSGCSPKEPEPRSTDVAPADTPPAAAPPVEKMVLEGPGEKLVREIGSWKLAAAPRYFGPENLYDLINGGAEVYVQFGLAAMVAAEYRDPAKPGLAVTAEIYDMGTPRGAFGRAARFLEGRRDPSGAGEGLPAAFAARGMMGDGDLVVWQDKYLVHLTLLDESPQATPEGMAAVGAEHLPRIAESLLARIGGETALPADLALFPTEDRIARSETWQPARLLDIDGLGSGYTVRYAEGGSAWIAFATEELPIPEAAEAPWKAVKSAMADGRRVALKVAGTRVVGIVQDGEAELSEALVERLSGALLGAFTAK
ncbi:MAG: hypothetical protein M0R80_12200 [Proteobacteria bacterium]|jgi:hypothetical protein|nr:hypothetical protein [Pseudomonadota bacterium]